MMNRHVILQLSMVVATALVACGDDAADSGKDAGGSGAQDARIADGQPVELDWECDNPSLDCGGIECPTSYYAGPLSLEGHDKRPFIIDYPCDLKTGDEVTLVLNLHGGGSFANWQRHYFPLKDFTDEYRLIVVQPQALTHETETGGSSTRWTLDGADDQYITDVLAFVDETFGKLVKMKRFWVVGHSNGGRYGKEIGLSPRIRGCVFAVSLREARVVRWVVASA